MINSGSYTVISKDSLGITRSSGTLNFSRSTFGGSSAGSGDGVQVIQTNGDTFSLQ